MKDIEYYRKNKDTLDWYLISERQKLSEDFIREFHDKVHWGNISEYQKLSEDFIRKNQDKVSWYYISSHQKLSEDFIREFQDKVNWTYISKYQKLSEDFIREFKDEVRWDLISKYQKLSNKFRKEFNLKEFNLKIPKTCWLYKMPNSKEKYIRKDTDYKIKNEMVIAYKAVRSDGYSVYNFQYHYEIGEEYESHCDCNINNNNSFGLSAWTLEGANNYYNRGRIFKVGIPIEDLGAVVHGGNKLRASRIRILDEVLLP